MSNEYIKEQIILMLMGEETDISEEEIRKAISINPELQAEYRETLSLFEAAKSRTPPQVTSSRWAEFMAGLDSKVKHGGKFNVLVRLSYFFGHHAKAAIAVSAAAAAVLAAGLIFIFINKDANNSIIVEKPEELNYAYESLEQIDKSFESAKNLLPADDELSLIENVYAEFAAHEKKSEGSSLENNDYELEEMKRYYNSDNENEDVS